MIAATKMFGLFILLLLVLAMHLVPSVVAQSLRSHDRGTSNQPANTRVMKQSSNIQGENDEVFSPLSSSKNETDQNVFYGTPKSAMKSDRNSIFANLASIESFKASQPSLWSTSHNGRLTLSKLHYVILPVWYADETQTAFDASTTAAIMRRVAAFYQQMSYGKFKLSWEILDPFPLTGITKGNPSLGSVQIAAEAHVKNLGLVNPIDYDGVITMYNQAQAGDLANGGGWGTSNGNFVWMTAPGDFYITRHEIGHNLGHPHHGANIYDWRLNEITYDGFDLVSGGGYNTSDFAAASKWHYNWITNDAIVLMQPEGPTQACPTCQAAVSRLVLKSFDKSSVIPSASNPVAIHIPLVGNSDKGMFSYWLSYRGVSNDGRARKGLSLHLTKLYSLGGPAAAHYDSVNFDAIGDTVDTIDSFILPSTCYVATAPVMLLLQGDNVEAPKVQPVICVDDIVPGSSITVSVSFLDPLAPPTPQASLASHQKFGCLPENGSRLDVSKSKVHLLSFQGTGTQGTINFSFCRESGTESVTAYFYDSYPHSILSYGSSPSYGALKSLKITGRCSTAASSLSYWSVDQTHVLLVSSSSSTSTSGNVQWKSSCGISTCFANQFANDRGTCIAKTVASPLTVSVPVPAPVVARVPLSPVRTPTSSGSWPSQKSPSVYNSQRKNQCIETMSLITCTRRISKNKKGYKMHRIAANGACSDSCAGFRNFWMRIYGDAGWMCGGCP